MPGNKVFVKGLIFFCIIFLFSGCTITPKPLSIDDRYKEAQKDLSQLYSQQESTPKKLGFYQALARGIKYNLDYRIKLVNTALQAGQLKIAAFTMFPALNTSYSVYSRNNQYASNGI